jgi:Na+/H+ antiporter NhaD/arsenite permease-like protein
VGCRDSVHRHLHLHYDGKNKPAIVAGLGAGLMITLGVSNQERAIAGVEFNTLGLLTGMMVIVAITRRCDIFQHVAIWSAKKVEAKPWGILLITPRDATPETAAYL